MLDHRSRGDHFRIASNKLDSVSIERRRQVATISGRGYTPHPFLKIETRGQMSLHIYMCLKLFFVVFWIVTNIICVVSVGLRIHYYFFVIVSLPKLTFIFWESAIFD